MYTQKGTQQTWPYYDATDTYDVYVTSSNTVRLIDFNPVGGSTATLLFDSWADLGYSPPSSTTPTGGDAAAAAQAARTAEDTGVDSTGPDAASAQLAGMRVSEGNHPTSSADEVSAERRTVSPDAPAHGPMTGHGLHNGSATMLNDWQQNGHQAGRNPPEVIVTLGCISSAHPSDSQTASTRCLPAASL